MRPGVQAVFLSKKGGFNGNSRRQGSTGIPFPLLCDPSKKVMEAYGAFGEKKMYGKLRKGVIRSTVWVAPDGNVRKHWAKVANAADHPANVLKVLQSSR
jgi:peroxiredoxin Q/BCP